jgi:hypothetical protein
MLPEDHQPEHHPVCVMTNLGLSAAAELQSILSETVRPSIVPIVAQLDDGQLKLVGTGFIYERSGLEWFVTAGHVLDESNEDGVSALLTGANGEMIIDTNAFHREVVRNENGNDVIDLAVARLKQLPGTSTGKNRVVIQCPESKAKTEGTLQKHVVLGFPETKNRKALENSKFRKTSDRAALIQQPISGTETPPSKALLQEGYSESKHIFIDHVPQRLRESDGGKPNLYPLYGLSGGPVFFIGDFACADVLTGKTKPIAQLSGVLIEHSKRDKKLIATRVEVLDALIDKNT